MEDMLAVWTARYDPSGLSPGFVLFYSLPNTFYPSCSQQEGCHIERLRACPGAFS